MSLYTRVEFPISSEKLVSKYRTMGDLKKAYPKLKFVKYIYIDPNDNKLKGTNPPDEVPLVNGAYLTVMGTFKDISKFLEKATEEGVSI